MLSKLNLMVRRTHRRKYFRGQHHWDYHLIISTIGDKMFKIDEVSKEQEVSNSKLDKNEKAVAWPKQSKTITNWKYI